MRKLDESLFRNLPPFSKLSPPQIREILDLGTKQNWRKNETVFEQGANADKFLLLLDGTIRVVKTTRSGDQIVPMHIPSGQLFGVAQALSLDAYPATAIAAVDCLTLSWPSRHWPNFVKEYDGFATESWRVIGSRIIELHDRIEELSTQAVEQRVALILLRLAREHGRKVENGTEISIPITRSTISDMAGTTLFTVSRVLSAWEKKDIIESVRKHITVTDSHRLAALADGGA